MNYKELFYETIPNESLIIEKNTLSDSVTVLGVKDKTLKNIKIPEVVTHIGTDAFKGCTCLNCVVIPYGVLEISSEAFSGCKSLIEMNLPDSIIKIGNSSFQGCTNLAEIKLPSAIEEIPSLAFDGCKSLKEIIIPNSVKNIGIYAFRDCKSLEKVVLPNCLREIGNNAFAGCTNLNSVDIKNPNFWFDVDFEYLANPCAYTKHLFCNNVEICSVSIPDNIAVIDKYIFRNCKFITKIYIPSSVKEIKDGAFMGCTNLESIQMPENLIEISEALFSDCVSLKEISIPNHVKKIGSNAFKNCINLQTVTISDGLIQIGSNAFAGCKALNHLQLPDSVCDIGNKAFVGCESLEIINTPESLTEISLSCFEGCTSLKKLYIPRKIEKILGYSDSKQNLTADIFLDSSNNNFVITEGVLIDNRKSAIVLVLPKNKAMQHYSIPNWVKEISYYAFVGCESLQTIDIPNSVIKIGFGAFQNCKSLQYLDIPENVKEIGDVAFAGCESLGSVDFAKNTSCYIGIGAFEGCVSLKSIFLPGSIDISFMAFRNCSNLHKIVLSEGIKCIAGDIIDGTAVQELSIPESLKGIDLDGYNMDEKIGAFPLSSLKEINVARNNLSYTSVGGILYNKDCTAIVRMPPHMELDQYSIKDGVKYIEPFAFYGCIYLRKITIPNSVVNIGEEAFMNTSLNEVHLGFIDVNKKEINYDFSDLDTDNCTLFVPSGKRWEYRHHPVFRKFKNIEIESE